MGRRLEYLCVTVLAILLVNAACRPKETELPFETVMKGEPQLLDEQGQNYTATYKNIDLMVATNSAEAQQIANTLSPERPGVSLEELADIDYREYLAIAAYFGAKPHGGFVITIDKITQSGRNVNLEISTVEPTGGDTVVVHPIHVVRIKRSHLPLKGRLIFKLWKEGEVVLAREHYVP
jgi:hypothetical protein